MDGISVIAATNSDLGPLMLATEEGKGIIHFHDVDGETYACQITVTAFDPAQHDLADITHGDCEWQFTPDLPALTGMARTVPTPQPFIEISVGEPKIADIQPISNRSVYLFGRSVGVTTLTTLGGGGALQTICPVVVQDAKAWFAENGVDEALLCRDRDGELARLTPGETVEIPFPEPGLVEIAIADRSIADTQSTKKYLVELIGVAPGWTNLTALKARGALLHDCLVEVE